MAASATPRTGAPSAVSLASAATCEELIHAHPFAAQDAGRCVHTVYLDEFDPSPRTRISGDRYR